MDSFEFELWIEQYKAIIKKTGERSLFPDEMKKLDENIDDMPEEYKDAYDRAKRGDYSKFEKLPHLLRNYLGAKALKEFKDRFGETPSLDDEGVRRYLEENAMNAALRAGISAQKNAIPHRGDSAQENVITAEDAAQARAYAKALDSHMNHILMKRTMMPPSERGNENLQGLYGNDRAQTERERNMAKQLVLAKAMLLAQIGKYEVIDKNRTGKELDVPVYETLVHGNRTNFVLPAGVDSKEVLDAFMGENGGAAAQIGKRTAATHSVKRRTIDKNGMLSSESKEERTYSPLKVFSNQFGMDLAVGGIGEEGPNGEIILGKGEAGHMYMRAEAGDSKHCGSLLIGIEGSAPGEDSYLGNEHGLTAKSAKQSAFLADKSIVGKKVGGRQVDLSGIDALSLAAILREFSEKYTALQRNADTPAGREKLEAVNEMLMGKQMTREAFAEMFQALDMVGEHLLQTVDTARKGYFNFQNIKQETLTEEDFKQKIRGGYSQEKACSLAQARFAYAEERLNSDAPEAEADGLELASGAIKELMLTHETRSLWWKIRHPIKNYRENQTISELMTRLGEHFEKEAIVSAFGFYDDTFALNWGEGLSNDRDAVKFAKNAEGHKFFKPSQKKLRGIFEKVSKDMQKTITEKEIAAREQTAMREELAQYEPKQFKDSELGLPKAPEGEYTENYVRMMRQQIVIDEENESNKSVDVEDEIIPEQPKETKQRDL